MRRQCLRIIAGMIQVDPMYLYSLGYAIHPLSELRADADFKQWLIPLYFAQSSLEGLLGNSVYQLRTSQTAGRKLMGVLQELTKDPNREENIGFYEAYQVTTGVTEFEHVLTAEFGISNLYLVQKMRGYDTTEFIQNGVVTFPPDLSVKVPEAVSDLNQATKCIAFDLPTAAGFHLHRANESVLHRWYDAVTNNAARPTNRNIGDYLAALQSKNVGKPKILSALKDLKDLHRNPLIHPEESLESMDEAIALMGSIHAVVTVMLRDIPLPASQHQFQSQPT